MIASRAWSSAALGFRSLLWAIAMPGIVAGYVPWTYFGLAQARLDIGQPLQLLGIACMTTGVLLLAACIFEFARSGRGTLSPVDPPRHLVVGGLYRYVRNPMYLSVTVIILGEALLTRSASLVAYWAIWFLFVNVFVVAYEEPTLRRQFGASYDAYARQVGRWIPKLTGVAPSMIRRKPHPPEVALFDLGANGAAFSWNGDESRAVALEMFVELARRLEGEERVARIRLSGLIGSAIDVADPSAFVRAAPELLQKLYRAYDFEFRLNEGNRAYRIRHLDQSVPGIAFDTPVDGEPFWSALGNVLADYARTAHRVTISTGPWYPAEERDEGGSTTRKPR